MRLHLYFRMYDHGMFQFVILRYYYVITFLVGAFCDHVFCDRIYVSTIM